MSLLVSGISFRTRKKKSNKPNDTESAKPFAWHEDEINVRERHCCFQVKYLGCVEVFESRGMHVCEEALRVLRTNAKKSERFSFRKKAHRQSPILALLYVSGDSLRIVENTTAYLDKAPYSKDDSGLIVDQVIEKVSFCAPDRNHDKGFAYICRDGTTRRWMCHGFTAMKESGERLSHAVGCAFAVCLEKKQQREKEAVTVSYNSDKTSFTRTGSFRQASLTERMQDPQSTKLVESTVSSPLLPSNQSRPAGSVDRPRPSGHTINKIETSKDFPKLSSSPFKRNASLRMNELPSTIQRQSTDFASTVSDAKTERIDNHSVEVTFDPILEMCQKLTQGLTTLSNPDSNISPFSSVSSPPHYSAPVIENRNTTNPFFSPPVPNSSPNTAHRNLHNVNSFPGVGHTEKSFHYTESSISLQSTNPFDTQWATRPLSTNPFLNTPLHPNSHVKQEFVVNM